MNKLKYALGLSTMLTLPALAQATQHDPNIFTSNSVPVYNAVNEQDNLVRSYSLLNSKHMAEFLGNQNFKPSYTLYNRSTPYTSRLTSEFSASINPNSSRWFANASASTDFEGDSYNRFTAPDVNDLSYRSAQYVNFPNAFTAVPILGVALERSVNKAIHRRIKKTAKLYERSDAIYEQHMLAEQINMMNEAYGGTDAAYVDSPYQMHNHYSYFDNGQHDYLANTRNRLSMFNPMLYNDIDSILTHFQATRKAPGTRLRGELGYKSSDFKWRMGIQQQNIDTTYASQRRQKHYTTYSTMNLKLSERMSYFNFVTAEKVKDFMGQEGYDRDKATAYHRINYELDNGASLFIAGGKSKDNLFGKHKYAHTGIKDCTTLASVWQMCSSLSYEVSKFDQADTNAFDIRRNNGLRATLTARVNF